MHETSGIPMRHDTGIDRNDSHTRVEWQPNDQTTRHTFRPITPKKTPEGATYK